MRLLNIIKNLLYIALHVSTDTGHHQVLKIDTQQEETPSTTKYTSAQTGLHIEY
jgi:hypothetical protein